MHQRQTGHRLDLKACEIVRNVLQASGADDASVAFPMPVSLSEASKTPVGRLRTARRRRSSYSYTLKSDPHCCIGQAHATHKMYSRKLQLDLRTFASTVACLRR